MAITYGAQVVQKLLSTILGSPELEQLWVFVDEVGVQHPIQKLLVLQDVQQERNISLNSPNAELTQGSVHFSGTGGQVGGMRNDLDQQRVVVRGYNGTRVGRCTVQSDAHALSGPENFQSTSRWLEIVGGILGRDAALDSVSLHVNVILRVSQFGQRCAFGDLDLRLHQIDACDLLRNGVLHLESSVHLDEVKVASVIEQELDCSRVLVAHVLGQADGIIGHPVAHLLSQTWCRGDFHHLLVTPLHRAISLEQVHHISSLVSQQLHFDVSGSLNELLDEHSAVSESCLRFRTGPLEHLLDLWNINAGSQFSYTHSTYSRKCTLTIHLAHNSHATTTSTVGRLEDHRQSMTTAEFDRFLLCVHWSISSGYDRHPSCDRCLSGSHFVSHLLDDLGGGSDEPHTCIDDGLGEVVSLREKPVAGMHSIDIILLAHANDFGNAQIRIDWRQSLAHDIRLIGLLSVHVHLVLLRVDGHRLDAQLIAGPEHTDRNLTTVGHQHGPDGLVLDFGGVRVMVEGRRPQTKLGLLQGAKSGPNTAERHLG